MTPHDDETPWEKVRRVFDAVATLEPNARDIYLRQLTTDPATRDAVQRLVAAHEALTDTSGPGQAQIDDVLSSLARQADDEHTIGGFHIERMLGEGGMGRVYAATRMVGGTPQKVALKIVPFVLRNERAIEQLRRERAILANLDHPNIARLIDAGELPDDRPWFAMEYVDGEPIARYCERHALDVRARLALFLDACEAVSYAHRQLVLHRDLKSGNILVDAQGRVRLLDFGIAKSLERNVARQDTTVGGGFFSLASASPEQVLGRATTVATDVYGLGCLLYELLAGCGPFADGERPREALVRAVIDETPPLVSNAAKQPALRGDLDTIVAKTLRKEPANRYRSVDELAADVRNVLEFKPIAARTSERWYRLARFVRRNRAAVTVAITLGAALLVATAVSIVQSRQAIAALAEARLQRDHARGVTDFLVKSFEAADPVKTRGRELKADELLASAVQLLERKSATLNPSLRAMIAQTLTQLFFTLDRPEDATLQAKLARQSFDEVGLPEPELAARQYYTDAIALQLAARYTEAIEATDTSLRIFDEGHLQDDDLFYQASFARARAHESVGREELAAKLYLQIIETLSMRTNMDENRIDRLRQAYASATSASGKFAEARELFATLLADQRARANPDEVMQIESLRGLGKAYGRMGDFEKSWPYMKEAYDRHVATYGEDNGRGAALLNEVASAMANLGQIREALPLRARAAHIGSRRLGATHVLPSIIYQRIGQDYHFGLRAYDQAERAFLRGLEVVPKEATFMRAALQLSYGELLITTGRFLEADYRTETACAALAELYGRRVDRCVAAQADLAYTHFKRYDFDGARQLLAPEVIADVKTIDRSLLWDLPRALRYDEMASFYGL